MSFVEKDTKFTCDNRLRYQRFKTFSICPHTIVVAWKLKLLDNFEQKVVLLRKKAKTSIMSLCNFGKDKGAGQKPRGTKRKGHPNYKAQKVLRHVDAQEGVSGDSSPSMVRRKDISVIPMRTLVYFGKLM